MRARFKVMGQGLHFAVGSMVVAGNDCDLVASDTGMLAGVGLSGACGPQPLNLPVRNGDEFSFLIWIGPRGPILGDEDLCRPAIILSYPIQQSIHSLTSCRCSCQHIYRIHFGVVGEPGGAVLEPAGSGEVDDEQEEKR